MDQLSLLIPIEQCAFIKTFSLYILSYHLHPLRSPLRSLTCCNLILSTRQTDASVGLCLTWPNHRRRLNPIDQIWEIVSTLHLKPKKIKSFSSDMAGREYTTECPGPVYDLPVFNTRRTQVRKSKRRPSFIDSNISFCVSTNPNIHSCSFSCPHL